jgi:hypothetical protein
MSVLATSNGSGVSAVGVCVILLASCTSPEEQRAMDQQQCIGYGFTPGTDGAANCMMGIAQQRRAEWAADQRQRDQNAAIAAIAAQAQRDRDAQAARDAAAAAVGTGTTDSGFPRIDIPEVEMPTAPANMNCTRTVVTSGNAGSVTEHCQN